MTPFVFAPWPLDYALFIATSCGCAFVGALLALRMKQR
jgi:hypothetical protein